MIFTSSFDDGSIYDLKMLELLNRYGLKATFYVSQNYLKEHLNDAEIKKISETQEIGAHSLTHPDLTKINLKQVQNEINSSKQWLEGLIKQQIKVFCYPKGKYNQQIMDMVKEAGFIAARTTQLGFYSLKDYEKRYCLPTTCLIFPPHHLLERRGLQGIALWHRKFNEFRETWQKVSKLILKNELDWQDRGNWLKIAKLYLNKALLTKGIFHLWGHTADIEKYNLWLVVEEFFQDISRIPKVSCLTNSEIIKT